MTCVVYVIVHNLCRTVKMNSLRMFIALSVLLGAAFGSEYTCTCDTCSALFFAESQCGVVGGTYTAVGADSATCDVDCVYYDFLDCGDICAVYCDSHSSSGGDNCGGSGGGGHLNNDGACSDKIYSQCVANVMENDGEFAYCDMCMCEEYESYGGSGSCGRDEVLYSCFISSSACKSTLRQSWIIGFAFIAVFICCCMGGIIAYFCCRGKNGKSVGSV